jgi:hypothetical protein
MPEYHIMENKRDSVDAELERAGFFIGELQPIGSTKSGLKKRQLKWQI